MRVEGLVMAYDQGLAYRLREQLAPRSDIGEMTMFGGLGFLLNGNMAVGIWKENLIVRVGPEAYRTALARDHVRLFDVTGRAMKGWIMVEPDGYADDEDLADWVEQGLAFAATLLEK